MSEQKLSDWLAEWWPFALSTHEIGNEAVARAKALEAKLEVMRAAITDDGRLKTSHFREWARSNDERNGYRDSVVSELLLRLIVAQQEQEDDLPHL